MASTRSAGIGGSGNAREDGFAVIVGSGRERGTGARAPVLYREPRWSGLLGCRGGLRVRVCGVGCVARVYVWMGGWVVSGGRVGYVACVGFLLIPPGPLGVLVCEVWMGLEFRI